MHEESITPASGEQSQGGSLKEICDDPVAVKQIEAAGYQQIPQSLVAPVREILHGKNAVVQSANADERMLAYLIPVAIEAAKDEDAVTLVIVASDTEAARIGSKLKRAEIPSTSASAGAKDLERARVIISTPQTLSKLSESGSHARIGRIVLDGLDSGPATLHAEASPGELVEQFFQSTDWSGQLLWLAASEPLNFRNILNARIRKGGAVEIDLEREAERNIEHLYVEVEGNLAAKPNALCDLIEGYGNPPTVIFCNSPSDADLVDVILKRRGIKAEKLIGHVPSRKIASAVSEALEGKLSALVVTDISARGVNVEDFEMVINHSLHSDPEVYIHRTGTPSASSRLKRVVSIIGPTDLADFHYLKKLFDFTFEKASLPSEEDLLKRRISALAVEPSAAAFDASKYASLADAVLEHDERQKILANLLYQVLEVLPELSSGRRGGRRDREEPKEREERQGRRGEGRGRQGRRDEREADEDLHEAADEEGRRGKWRQEQPPAPPKRDVRFYIGHGLEEGFSEEKLRALLQSSDSLKEIAPERVSVRSKYSFADFPEASAPAIENELPSLELSEGIPLVAYKAAIITAPRDESSQTADSDVESGSDDHGPEELREAAE